MARRLLPQRSLTVFPQPAGASGTATASRKSCSFWDPQALDDTGTSGQSLSPRQAVAGQPTKTSHSWMTAFLQNKCVTFFFFFSVCYFFHGLGSSGAEGWMPREPSISPCLLPKSTDGATEPGATSPDVCCSILRFLVLSVSQKLSIGRRKGKAGVGEDEAQATVAHSFQLGGNSHPSMKRSTALQPQTE